MANKINWAEVAIGAILLSPLDEILIGTATAGASVPIAGAQLPLTAALGSGLILHGLRVIK